MYQHILVPTDGSDITGKAVDSAVAIAKLTGGSISTISVQEPFPYMPAGNQLGGGLGSDMLTDVPPMSMDVHDALQQRLGQGRVDAVVRACTGAGVRCTAHTVAAPHPWQAIIEYAAQAGCDLIVMASHGRRGMSALLLGSETQKVLTHTTIPVLVVR